ncbi:MAG: hydantoinase/oxoprolinase family protein, partial [Alphaproteobacteria bacterium]|nr:hydantoinase/oxoprolinase family protein [Alphaproteobacteria bacterium]
DMLYIGRQEKTHIYDMFYRKPDPFTDRANVYEVAERIGPDGAIIDPIDRVQVAEVVGRLIEQTGVDSIAVCLLHAYANPAHERIVAEVVAERHPEVRVVLSSDVCPVHREFERASTTVINAFLNPVVDRYLGRFAQVVREAGCAAEPLIMQANGGVLPVPTTRQRPAGLFLSGPSAAVAGAASLAQQVGLPSLITLDVGGTSTDICLVTDGEAHETGHGGAYGTVQGQPLNMVMTDIVTIGAGGGSLAWVDEGGMLKVGPRSAGADPGPACYGRGGDGFTLTDAMLCLGLLANGAALPGGIRLSLASAQKAATPLMDQLAFDHLALADSVYRIAIANMAEAIRSVTVRRGYDPRDYALFACGGAGPMVAALLAAELDVGSVLVPPDPGVFSAFGLTAAGLRMDFARAVEQGSAAVESAAALDAELADLREEARRAFAESGVEPDALKLAFTADARYAGQGFELRVPFDGAVAAERGAAYIADEFHGVHTLRYGHAFADQPVEITALRLTASLAAPSVLSTWHTLPAGQDADRRRISLGETGTDATVLDRAGMTADQPLSGPALCVEPTTTTVVPAGWAARTDAFGLMHLQRENA